MNQEDLEFFANIILNNLKEEFSRKKLSGNLLNTVTVEQTEKGEIRINIPAQTYNMLLYQQKGVVVHTSHGSYASKLDEEGSSFYVYPNGTRKGSFKIKPGNHKDYVNELIQKSLRQFISMKQLKVARREDTGY